LLAPLAQWRFFALGIMPYIRFDIIQLMTLSVPTLEHSKERGEQGP